MEAVLPIARLWAGVGGIGRGGVDDAVPNTRE